ncbi:glucosamine-6-phosphate deaminase [Zobellia uliginosa]|uniref:Glucosamine-6-phosphate deaminase n=1 Tax=Zobellia uliginosa TaxID=143224 RepID=A0ABY1KQH5_9FLAO|nr:6-phosphogluconolactonase [Zobellia uliginosa]SIS47821.1 glucosamine-6-phosphate deaminase [Zobellia uliginosa]
MLDYAKNINVFPSRTEAGTAAGKAIEKHILKLQERQEVVRIIFAAAPSQDAMLEYLAQSPSIRWDKIVALHMDEYIGLPKGARQHFSKYLEDHLFSKVGLKERFLINPHTDLDEELERYSKLVNEGPIDLVCAGIGENGHIAFNDPPVAHFDDPETVKIVTLDEGCRQQQVNDGCFASLDQVPEKALTLTIPALMKGEKLFCIVLGAKKSEAVKNSLLGPITTECPASILATHANCEYYFDEDAYQGVLKVSS